jgi:hypothetical protein
VYSSPLLGHRNASRRTRLLFSSVELPCGRYGGPNVVPSVLAWTENHSSGKPLQLISWQYISGKCLFGHLTANATIDGIVAAARGSVAAMPIPVADKRLRRLSGADKRSPGSSKPR